MAKIYEKQYSKKLKCIFLMAGIFGRQTNNWNVEEMSNKINFNIREVYYTVGRKYSLFLTWSV